MTAHTRPGSVSLTLLALAAAHLGTVTVVPAAQDRPVATVRRGIVVLVRFPDVPGRLDQSAVHGRFSRQLAAYVNEMSYGRVSLRVETTRTWYALPDPVGRYRISPRNLEVDRSRVRKLIDDATGAADAEVDFAAYDFTAIYMDARIADYGMVGLCGYPGMLGWEAADDLKTRGGERVNGGVAIFTGDAHLGTLFHDVAHVLGGVEHGQRRVPCLYDHDLQARPGPMRDTFEHAIVNMGFWDPMSCHYYQRTIGPPGISSWTRLRLGWMDPSKIAVVRPGERKELTLGPLEDAASTVLAVRIPLSSTRYYLVENRQPIGFDRFLPGSGVLIMLADDDVAECRHGKAPVKLVDADPSVPTLKGAAFDIGRHAEFRDDRNRVGIRLLGREGPAYRVLVSRQ